jgi:hypothetical protein
MHARLARSAAAQGAAAAAAAAEAATAEGPETASAEAVAGSGMADSAGGALAAVAGESPSAAMPIRLETDRVLVSLLGRVDVFRLWCAYSSGVFYLH